MTDPTAASAGAKGAAYGMTIKVENTPAALSAALAHARELERTQQYHDAVAKVKGKITKLEDALAGARESLAIAEAELDVELERVEAVRLDAERIAALPVDERTAAEFERQEAATVAREAWRAQHAIEREAAKAAAH